jgi:hypothetical protein
MTATVNEIVEAIAREAETHKHRFITPTPYSYAFGNGKASAAFRIAQERGLIVYHSKGPSGTSRYEAA